MNKIYNLHLPARQSHTVTMWPSPRFFKALSRPGNSRKCQRALKSMHQHTVYPRPTACSKVFSSRNISQFKLTLQETMHKQHAFIIMDFLETFPSRIKYSKSSESVFWVSFLQSYSLNTKCQYKYVNFVIFLNFYWNTQLTVMSIESIRVNNFCLWQWQKLTSGLTLLHDWILWFCESQWILEPCITKCHPGFIIWLVLGPKDHCKGQKCHGWLHKQFDGKLLSLFQSFFFLKKKDWFKIEERLCEIILKPIYIISPHAGQMFGIKIDF